MGTRTILSLVCGLYLLLNGLPTALGLFGLPFPFLLSFMPSMVNFLFLIVSSLVLAIDGFGEDGMIKKLSLITAGVLAIFFIVPVLSYTGIADIPLPGFLYAIQDWLYILAGLLLIRGIFAHHM